MNKSTITYVKRETDGKVSEEIHIQTPDVRYETCGGTENHLTLAQAHELLARLSEVLSKYPY